MTDSLPIVLVPGLLCTPRLYAEQLPHLWTFGSVTIADHRRDVDVESIAKSILASAPPRFALVGLSMGGYLANTITRLAPERVERLALLSSGARADTPEATERRKKQIALTEAGRFHEIPDLLMPLFLHERRRSDAGLQRIVKSMAAETGPEAFVRQLRALMSRPDARPSLPNFRCKTLVLVGDGDTLTPPELSEEIASLVPGSRLVVVPDCGHLSTLEQPEAVTNALVDWLKA